MSLYAPMKAVILTTHSQSQKKLPHEQAAVLMVGLTDLG